MDSTKDRLRAALDARGMRATDLAEKIGVSRASISQYLSGRSVPLSARLHEIALALNVSEAYLLGYDVGMEREVKVELTAEELDLVKFYRQMDVRGKELINIIMEREISRNGGENG